MRSALSASILDMSNEYIQFGFEGKKLGEEIC